MALAELPGGSGPSAAVAERDEEAASSGPARAGVRRRLEVDGAEPTAAPAGCSFLSLADDERQRALSFAAGLSTAASLAATCRRCRQAGQSPAAWEAAVVEVGAKAFASQEAADKLVALGVLHWGLAREVLLPPHRLRRPAEQRLREAWPQLLLTVKGEGPFLLFAMAAENFRVGTCTALHFFEPRYKWMCKRLFEGEERPPVFGWVTSGRPCVGARGSLCEVTKLTANRGGTYDVAIRAKASFELLEVWTETSEGLPRAAPLYVGYVRCLEDARLPRSYLLGPGRSWEVASDSEELSDEEVHGLLGPDAIDQVLAQLVSQGRGLGGLELAFPGADESEDDAAEDDGDDDDDDDPDEGDFASNSDAS